MDCCEEDGLTLGGNNADGFISSRLLLPWFLSWELDHDEDVDDLGRLACGSSRSEGL